MNLSKLLSTKERVAILNELLFKKGNISVADFAKNLKLSKGFISKFFVLLSQQKILKKSRNKYVLMDNLNVHLLRILLNLKQFADFNFKKYPFVKGAGLYGSCVKGENTEDSDIDIWIKIDTRNEERLARLTSELKKRFKKISPLYLTQDKLDVLKKDDLPFYHSLVFSSIRLYGEDIV